MKIRIRTGAEIEISDRQKVNFPRGLLGFERFADFALIDAEQPPFFYLQSIENYDLAFVLIDPFLFRADYQIDLSDEMLAEIGIEDPQDALVFAIVTIPSVPGEKVTANLMGPVIINKKTRTGMQAVLSDPRWLVKHDIVREMGKE